MSFAIFPRLFRKSSSYEKPFQPGFISTLQGEVFLPVQLAKGQLILEPSCYLSCYCAAKYCIHIEYICNIFAPSRVIICLLITAGPYFRPLFTTLTSCSDVVNIITVWALLHGRYHCTVNPGYNEIIFNKSDVMRQSLNSFHPVC